MTLVMIEHMQSGKGIYNKDEYNLKHILLELCTHTRVIGLENAGTFNEWGHQIAK